MDEDDILRRQATPSGAAGRDATAERVAELEAELAAAREEARQNHDRWVRERADLENQRKRAARERQDATRFGTEALMRDLLPVVDNLERAIEAAGGADAAGSLRQGVQLVLKALLDALQRHGVERLTAEGAPFDPTQHEAVAHVESATHPAGQILQQHQAGYRLHDRLLRPALVTVSKGTPGSLNLANDGGGD
ncbi:MAG TPA: nucleotide exchange factor GrpE [Candidatus Eisenbacteria bacterium]|nr:nucleotide exchange factor GrpE [Candidatus Eisenbacteria bacterium]